MLLKQSVLGSVDEIFTSGPPTTGGPGGHGPSTFLQKNAVPKFVDNRFNSLKSHMLI